MRRSGFSLIEMLLVVVIIGIVSLVGLPKLREALIGTSVRGARSRVVAMYSQARAAAIDANRKSALIVRNGSAWVTRLKAVGAGVDTVGSVQSLAAQFGVTVTASQDSVPFDPRGVVLGGLGTPVTVVVARDGSADTVTINGLGGVQ